MKASKIYRRAAELVNPEIYYYNYGCWAIDMVFRGDRFWQSRFSNNFEDMFLDVELNAKTGGLFGLPEDEEAHNHRVTALLLMAEIAKAQS